MNRFITSFIACALLLVACACVASVSPYPASFKTETIAANGTRIFVRVGGHGPAVVMLHGFGESGDMWQPLAVAMAKNHTVIVPDLRGMGLSAHPPAGYDKKNQGRDISGVLDALHVGKVDVVAHDIGNMVAFAFVAEQPQRVGHLVLMDAPIPGVGPWEEILKTPMLWHFHFYGPDMERLVKGRERIYLDRFWNEFSADPRNFDEASRVHYAKLYALPNAMHDGFEQFHAFDQDALDNHTFLASGPLQVPVLAVGGEKSFGPEMAVVAKAAFSNVKGVVIPHSGHWLMEENPKATIAAVQEFIP